MHTPDYTLLTNPVHREYEIEYRRQFGNAPLEDIIVFRSGPHENSYVPGMDYADNARALFEYMLSVHLDDKYTLVWLVKKPEEFADKPFARRNVRFIAYDWATTDDVANRNAYYDVMCKAKYIFMTDAYGFAGACREDQIRIQLWHGCGFKTRVNFSSCENRYEYNIVISEKYRQIHRDIYGLRDDQVVITGYPKQDWLHMPYKEPLNEILDCVKADKYILWLPTFRMAQDQLSELNQYNLITQTGLPIVGTVEQLRTLNDYLAERDLCIIIKLHPFQKKGLVDVGEYSNIKLLYNEDLLAKDLIINRILADADALISDYSSAAIDYLSLDRPIAFTLDDVEEYEQSRGFVFDPIKDWIPGQEIYNFEDFLRYINEVFKGEDSAIDKRRRLMNQLVQYRDGNNCKRVVEWLRL